MKESRIRVKRLSRRGLLAFILLLLSAVSYEFREKQLNVHEHVQGFQHDFLKTEARIMAELEAFGQKILDTGIDHLSDPEYIKTLETKFERDGLVYTYSRDDSLLFWSHNALLLEDFVQEDELSGVQRARNGWFYFRHWVYEQHRFSVWSVLKTDFRYQNRFLRNDFQHHYSVPSQVFFISDKPAEGFRIYDQDEQYVFSLVPRSESALIFPRNDVVLLSLLLAISGLLVLVFAAFRYFSWLFTLHRTLAITGFASVMLIMRLIGFWLRIPRIFFEGQLFSPSLYASSVFLPSLGDLLLNVLILAVIGFFLYTHMHQIGRRVSIRAPWRWIWSAFLMGLIYPFCIALVYIIQGLVTHSNLNLDVNFIFQFDLYSLVGFLIIGCLFFSFFFFGIVLMRLALRISGSRRMFWFLFVSLLLVFIGVHWLLLGPAPVLWMLFASTMPIFLLDKRKSDHRNGGFTQLITALFLFSLICTYALHRYNSIKDLDKRKSLAMQLSSEQNPLTEYLFSELEDALFNDNQLKNMVLRDPFNEAAVYRYLQHHYFYGFWARYDLQITICRPEEIILLKPSNVEVECGWLFEDYIRSVGRPTLSRHLTYLDNNTGRISYIARIPVSLAENEEPVYHLNLEFDSKFFARDMGFPELLIDDQVDINRDLLNYSHATYIGGWLINKFGPYIYSHRLNVYGDFSEEFTEFSFENHLHLVYHRDEDTHIVISRPKQGFLELIAPFSYLFVLFFLLIAAFYLLTSRGRAGKLFSLHFRRRVQYAMIGIVLASVLTIGGASAVFILNVSQNKNLAFLNEKAHSVLTEMEHELSGAARLDDSHQLFLTDLLVKLSNIFFTDINLYDPSGHLLASSRSKVFEEGLVSTRMNPGALAAMKTHQKSRHLHNERIGKLQYMSAYMPLRNNYQELLAYINLPYFAKQSELRNELSYFLVAFINIYLLLLLVAIITALFISNYVTRPLQLIRDKLAQVQLGKVNQKIEWLRNDEIGNLVSEYNRMIDELAASAELLARSERESAWREMAKQVAHEIKNPLTPMRLNVQYLEKAWKEKVPDWDARLERFAKAMVEQIDHLALIAGAFSDFAKLPAGRKERIDLRRFVKEVLELYMDFERVSMSLDLPSGEESLVIKADRSQLLRVFNNLISNAIQAYPRKAMAQVDIQLSREGTFYRIDIRDYGCGIPDHLKPNIFSPNFTTKTGGTGLGLSMVRNIAEGSGGKVSFDSEENKGSQFSVFFPADE